MNQQNVPIIGPDVSNYVPKDVLGSKYVDVHSVLKHALSLTHKDGKLYEKIPNILLNGDHGLGKTLLVATFREDLEQALGGQSPVPMITVNCNESTERYNLVGLSMMVGDHTPFVLGPIPAAIELANKTGACILNLEEISRLRPGAQGVLNGPLDWTRGITIEEISKRYTLNSEAKLITIATMNPSRYQGTYELNQDLRSRFQEFRLEWPEQEREAEILKAVCPDAPAELIDQLTMIAAQSRTSEFDYHLSTRDLVTFLQSAKKLAWSLEVPALCLTNNYESSQRDTIADRVDAQLLTNVKSVVRREVRIV